MGCRTGSQFFTERTTAKTRRLRKLWLTVAGWPLSLTACDTGRQLGAGYAISPAFLDDRAPVTPQPLSLNDTSCNGTSTKSVSSDCSYLHKGFQPPIHLESYTFPSGNIPLVQQATTSDSARDMLKNALILRSDAICASTKAQIAATKDTVNFGFGAAGAVAGGVGGVVSGVAANVMSSVSGLMSGLDGLASKNFWQSAVDYAIMQQITTARDAQRKSIDAFDGKPVTTYSVGMMLRDVGQYHEACSFTSAVTTIIQNAATNGGNAADSTTAKNLQQTKPTIKSPQKAPAPTPG
jgi:hypothetical protein